MSNCEAVLSALSHYFYLGGACVTVLNGNKAQFEDGQISFKLTAVKIASYILLFPLTIPLFAINLYLRYQHHLTISDSSQLSVGEIPVSQPRRSSTDSTEGILAHLITAADQDEEAFLIDFSQVKPSNIFEIFEKDFQKNLYGWTSVSDTIHYDESDKFSHNFPFKYSISIVALEKNDFGYTTSNSYMFTMNDEGKVESYGTVFDSFDLYLENRLKEKMPFQHKWISFDHFDFQSVSQDGEHKTLRKKLST